MPSTVYAAEFLPPIGEGGIAGMEWYRSEDDGVARYRQLVDCGDPGSVCLHEITVDAEDDDTVTDQVQDYLDTPEGPPLLTITRPAGTEPRVVVEQGNIHRAVWELRVQSLAELIDAVGGHARDSTWRSWNLPWAAPGSLYDGLCGTARISVVETNRPRLAWIDDTGATRMAQGQPIEPQWRDGHLDVIQTLEQIAASLTAALDPNDTTTTTGRSSSAPSTSTFTARGVSARINAARGSATAADPEGVVSSFTVPGHPGVTVHAHSSTTVDGAVTVLVDAPEGMTIRFDVNDASIAETTVGDDTVRVSLTGR